MNRDEKQILNAVLPQFINMLLKDGFLTDADLLDKKILNSKIITYVDKNKTEFNFTVDHRKSILLLAEQEYNTGHEELAISLYATYIEHTLNKIIHLECTEREFENKIINEIIKSVNIGGKCSWLLKLLGLPNIKEEYSKYIIKISEARNSYIHYKWKAEDESNKVQNIELEKIKKTIKYLKNYESKHEFNGKKIKISKASKR